MRSIRADAAIIGGGFGGVSAALALLKRGRTVVMVERYPWIGGQVTSQALCVADDLHDPIGESTGVNLSYANFRRRVRDAYVAKYPLSSLGRAQLYLNPGNAICSHLTAEPQVAHAVLLSWLDEVAPNGDHLRILTGYAASSFRRDRDVVTACRAKPVEGGERGTIEIEADFFLDATETGETYPLLELPFRIGSEARGEFGEPHAPEAADASAVQSFTFCIALEFAEGTSNRIERPRGYEALRDRHGFYLYAPGANRENPAKFFEAIELGGGRRVVPFWSYRSVVDPRNFAVAGLPPRAIINVPGNDYHDAPFIGLPDDADALENARTLAKAYLYWLQTEAPRDEGGSGYPELRPVPEMTNTPDGIAMAPYIREGRRLEACTTISECDIHAEFFAGSRARVYSDSVGLGGYFIDLHQTTGRTGGLWEPTRPYQIPLGALVSPELRNFAVANKGIGVTQIANGAYRLHPEEWAIGEAAGMLADYCLAHQPAHPWLSGDALRRFQRRLAERGVPLYWYSDVPHGLPGFSAIQMLAVEGIWPGADGHLRCDPYESVNLHRQEFVDALERLPKSRALAEVRDVFLTAHNARKHDVMRTLDILRQSEPAG